MDGEWWIAITAMSDEWRVTREEWGKAHGSWQKEK
jgi:hypothetical protein